MTERGDRVRQAMQNQSEAAKCAARRERVLAHPQIAARLTEKPLSYNRPDAWNGWIPPSLVEEAGTGRMVINRSPRRRALIDICTAVLQAEDQEAAELAEQQARADTTPISPPLIDNRGLTYLHTLLSKAGVIEREDKLATIEEAIGHPVGSSRDLTRDEATLVIRKLREVLPAWPPVPPDDGHEEAPLAVEDVPMAAECTWCQGEGCTVCRPDSDGPDYEDERTPNYTWGSNDEEPPY